MKTVDFILSFAIEIASLGDSCKMTICACYSNSLLYISTYVTNTSNWRCVQCPHWHRHMWLLLFSQIIYHFYQPIVSVSCLVSMSLFH